MQNRSGVENLPAVSLAAVAPWPEIPKMALEAMKEQTRSMGRKRGRWRTHHEQNRRQEQNEDGRRLDGATASMMARVAAA